MRTYADAMFGAESRKLQARAGSLEQGEIRYAQKGPRGLDADGWAFLADRQSVYIATLTEEGHPYVQHRGGPRGFLRQVGEQTIGFADYRGNRQFISQGNLLTDDRISLFAMDYARRGRLKVQGRAKLVEAAEASDMIDRVWQEGEPRPERIFTITVEAIDWNCPKYIPRMFDEEQIAAMMAPEITRLQDRIAELEAALAAR